jgi:rhodanese-related sulfurtransferase
MINFIKKIFGLSTAVNYIELVQQGAIIIDVRTRSEYKQGHVKNRQMPLNELSNHIAKLKKRQCNHNLLCFRNESASAKNILNLMVLQAFTTVVAGVTYKKKLL